MGQGSASPDVRRSSGADAVQSQLGGPDDRRIAEDGDRRRGGHPGDAVADAVEECRVVVAEDPAAQDHIDIEPGHAETADGGGRQRHDLIGLSVDDRARDSVAPGRGLEHHRRELRDAGRRRVCRCAGPSGPGTVAGTRGRRGSSPAGRSWAPDRPRTGWRASSPASPMSLPPPQSPEIGPTAGKRVIRPSGATPEQLMPYPQTTPTPQSRSVPARSTANVSLRTSRSSVTSRIRSQRSIRRSSTGKSAPARQKTPSWATGIRSALSPASTLAAATASRTWPMWTSPPF